MIDADGQTLAGLATLTTVITGALLIARAFWAASKATVARRWILRRTLVSLTPGMQLAYFEEMLGVASYKQAEEWGSRHVWVKPECYVVVTASHDGIVSTYAVTTRRRWFRPTFFRGHTITGDGESIEVKLGKSTFGDFSPDSAIGEIGARRTIYSQSHNFGNPGLYMTYVHTLNDAGYIGQADLIPALLEREGLGFGALSNPDEDSGTPPEWFTSEAFERARRRTQINTLGLTTPFADNGLARLATGPDLDLVRLLPETGVHAALAQAKRRLTRWKLRPRLGSRNS